MSIIWLRAVTVSICLATFASGAQGGGFLKPGSVVLASERPGATCDIEPYAGQVPEQTLASAPAGADVIEVLEVQGTTNKQAKRMRVEPNQRIALPMVTSDGACAALYDMKAGERPTEAQLNTLLMRDEKLGPRLDYEEQPGTGGVYTTTDIFLIVPAN